MASSRAVVTQQVHLDAAEARTHLRSQTAGQSEFSDELRRATGLADAPDKNGEPRSVLVFRLTPLGEVVRETTDDGGPDTGTPEELPVEGVDVDRYVAERPDEPPIAVRREALLDQWGTVLDAAKQTANYSPSRNYGPFQIAAELNTTKQVAVGPRLTTVYDYPILNGELRTLKALAARYHADVIAPKLWHYELLK